MFNRCPKNEKWETIHQRQRRKDIVAVVIGAPIMYIWAVLIFAL
jgi:hypothetical protein